VLGPLFFCELVHAGRRSRYTLLRLYVYVVLIILLYILTLCLAGWWADYRPMVTLPAAEAAGIFQSFLIGSNPGKKLEAMTEWALAVARTAGHSP
jgi:hypothetical protein